MTMTTEKDNDMEEKYRGGQCLWRNKNEGCHRCLARSLSPPRNSSSYWEEKEKGQRNSQVIDDSAEQGSEGIKVVRAATPSTFVKPKGSRRKWSLRNIFLPRSKSDGRELERDEMELSFSSYAKLSLSDYKEKKQTSAQGKPALKKMAEAATNRTAYISSPNRKGIPVSAQELHHISSPNRKGVLASAQELHHIPSPNRRGVPVSAHELHYTANRAEAEQLRRKTFLPYKRGVLGCLGFPSSSSFPQGQVLQPLY